MKHPPPPKMQVSFYNQQVETEPVEEAIQEDGDHEGKEKKKKSKKTEDPVVDADAEKKKKRSKESKEPAVDPKKVRRRKRKRNLMLQGRMLPYKLESLVKWIKRRRRNVEE
jgi:nucleolar protein 58